MTVKTKKKQEQMAEDYALYLYSVDVDNDNFTGEEQSGFYLIAKQGNDVYYLDTEDLYPDGPIISPLLCCVKNKSLLDEQMKRVSSGMVPSQVLESARSENPQDYSIEMIFDENDEPEDDTLAHGEWIHITDIEDGVFVPTADSSKINGLSLGEINFIAGTAGLIIHTNWKWDSFIEYQLENPYEWHWDIDAANQHHVNHIFLVCGVITKAIIDNGYPNLTKADDAVEAELFMRDINHIKLISSLSGLTVGLSAYEFDCCHEWMDEGDPYALPHVVVETINKANLEDKHFPFYWSYVESISPVSVLDVLYNSKAVRYSPEVDCLDRYNVYEKKCGGNVNKLWSLRVHR